MGSRIQDLLRVEETRETISYSGKSLFELMERMLELEV